MFDSQRTLRPALFDAATVGDVDAVLARWVAEDPGLLAVTELAAIDPTTLGATDRVRLLIAWDRQSAWVAAQQLPVLVAVGDAYADTVADAWETATDRLTAAETVDPAAATADRGGRTVAATVSSILGDDPDRWATVEIAAALRIAETTAGMRLHLARALPIRLPMLERALRSGRVSFGHVLLVARETAPLTDELALGVDARLARRYGTATPGGLRSAARHATIAADPAGAQARHDEAARRRSLSTRPEPEGMASLNLFAAAPDVAIVDSAVSDIAERIRAAANAAGRLIPDQDSLHADALVAMARYWLHDTWPVPEPDPREGPPAGTVPAKEFSAGEPSAGEPPPGDAGAPGVASCNDPPVRTGKCGRRRRGRDRTVVNIVIDLPTLLGLADNPARLDGYGSIPPGLARRLASDAAWRRMITDPITRRLLDRAPSTYRPGDQLAAYVRARDLVCDHPGCTRPAEGCQLDHDAPFDLADPEGGRTIAEDLYLRCEPHHNGKTHLGWATGTRADGTRYTRSPLGFDYDLEPNAYLDVGRAWDAAAISLPS